MSRTLPTMGVLHPLTGMPNRVRFLHTFKALHKQQEDYTLFLMDLDNFKQVNDTYGHNIGDKALCRVAAAIREIIPAPQFAARWGGDEFIGLLPRTDAASKLETLRRSIATYKDPSY